MVEGGVQEVLRVVRATAANVSSMLSDVLRDRETEWTR